MNKYQKRRNRVKRFEPFLNKNQINSIIYDDNSYNSFLNLVIEFEREGIEILKQIMPQWFNNIF